MLTVSLSSIIHSSYFDDSYVEQFIAIIKIEMNNYILKLNLHKSKTKSTAIVLQSSENMDKT